MKELIVIFCPDCRGKIEVEHSDIVEDELIECDLCGAELLVMSENPIKFKMVELEDEV
ncbi:lysine biosynthesis protein LysW [bacterium]|jgi:lysine biosynthesis protein LysW|nr:lysine biosynthesis protein LysW [bacterium]MBT6831857.1 lysine biosynthesis protein LysW [bacterium]MBT6996246.1 lysine biosynthesis protein LysW [bacterium]MBT7772587.1 lysine biosynthesis protein LysW [bacterium]